MRVYISIFITGLTLFLGAGCGQMDNPTGPVSGQQTTPALWPLDLVTDIVWKVVCAQEVDPGQVTSMKGSRYTLTFQSQSLLESLLVTIKERDPDIVDVELGPDGSQFYKPVTLTIDYSKTRYDQTQPNYAGRRPNMFWFNPDTQAWVLVPGTDDPRQCLYTVNLQHFSRYAMGDGTSGWEDGQDDHGKEFVK